MDHKIEEFLRKCEDLGWHIAIYEDEIYLSKCSSGGQDFSVSTPLFDNPNDFIGFLSGYYVAFDPSEEAYIWLDNTGHGKNGAPYEMIDVYKDMVECKNSIKELYEYLEKYLGDTNNNSITIEQVAKNLKFERAFKTLQELYSNIFEYASDHFTNNEDLRAFLKHLLKNTEVTEEIIDKISILEE